MTDLLKHQCMPELMDWQLLVTHSVTIIGWDKLLKAAVPSFDFKRRHYNVFPFLSNCGENSLPVSMIQAIFQACSALQESALVDILAPIVMRAIVRVARIMSAKQRADPLP